MKTPEELAEEAINERWKISDMPTSREGYVNTLLIRIGGYRDGFLAGYQAAAPQWISVKDRLPEVDGELVLVSDGTRRVTATYYHVGERFHFYHPHLTDITYWMPLPSSPEGKE
jgi:hypothetical protein